MITIQLRRWMTLDHGTVISAGYYNDPEGYFVEIQHGDEKMAIYENALALVHRPSPMEGGADEYDEIMACYDLMDKP